VQAEERDIGYLRSCFLPFRYTRLQAFLRSGVLPCRRACEQACQRARVLRACVQASLNGVVLMVRRSC
jgi:hypothetical protein